MATLYEYLNTGEDDYGAIYGANWAAQTFTPATAHRITSVKLMLVRAGSPGDITVSIRATDGTGHPTGADICSGITNGNTLPESGYGEWREITLTPAFNFKAATKYAIVVRALGATLGNHLSWSWDTEGGYAAGNGETSINSGGTWTAQTYDFMFENWGEAVPTYDMPITSGATASDSLTSFRTYPLVVTSGAKVEDSLIADLLHGLLWQQKRMGHPLCKLVLTKAGQDTQTFGVDTTTRLLSVRHTEQTSSHTAEVLVQNANGALTALNLLGYIGVLSYGYTTNYGDLYRARAPLKVIAKELYSSPGNLSCHLSLIGIPDQMALTTTTTKYRCPVNDGRTVKTLITQLMDGTLVAFGNSGITIDWDSEDSIIDVFTPNDLFGIQPNDNLLAKVDELLAFTGCVRRFPADGHMHVFLPKAGVTWVANTAYKLSNYAQPTTPNDNFTYKCTTAGTSHATTEPTWPTTAGATVTDGTVVWTAEAPDYEYADVI